jgi:hypothetical protein
VELTLKRKVAIGAAGLAVLAGAGGTYAATRNSGTDERQAFLNDAAKRLNVSPKQLEDALQGAFFDRLDAAVAAGRLTRAQADAIKQRVKQGGGAPFLGSPFLGPVPGGHPGFPLLPPGGPLKGGIDAAAKYLGLTDAQLVSQLESGKSLAQVAKDRDKSVDGLKAAIKDAFRAKLDAAVKAKQLTKAQEDQALANLDRRIDEIVDHTGFGPRFGELRRGGPRWAPPGGRVVPPPGAPRRGGWPRGGSGWAGPPPPP